MSKDENVVIFVTKRLKWAWNQNEMQNESLYGGIINSFLLIQS